MALPANQEIFALFGKRVKVVLDTDRLDLHVKPRQGAVIITGTLLGFGEGGEFEILEDDGFVHYCWPMLRIEEA